MKGFLAAVLVMGIVLAVDLMIHFWPLILAGAGAALIVVVANRRRRRVVSAAAAGNVLVLPFAVESCADPRTDGRPRLRLVQGGLA